jgi:hypothetical protein
LFRRVSIFSSPCVDPLTWWCMHEDQFQKVSFFFSKIDSWNPKFTNKNWISFSFVMVLTTLRRCNLEVDNMAHIIINVKNWLDNPQSNCKPNSNFKQYLKIEKLLANDNYNLISISATSPTYICCLWPFLMVSCMLLSHGSQAVQSSRISAARIPMDTCGMRYIERFWKCSL